MHRLNHSSSVRSRSVVSARTLLFTTSLTCLTRIKHCRHSSRWKIITATCLMCHRPLMSARTQWFSCPLLAIICRPVSYSMHKLHHHASITQLLFPIMKFLSMIYQSGHPNLSILTGWWQMQPLLAAQSSSNFKCWTSQLALRLIQTFTPSWTNRVAFKEFRFGPRAFLTRNCGPTCSSTRICKVISWQAESSLSASLMTVSPQLLPHK